MAYFDKDKRKAGKNWTKDMLTVGDASHMKRSQKWFAEQGIQTVIKRVWDLGGLEQLGLFRRKK
mgnify:CR=1 FL=1